jgi:hypothetical protein
VVEIIKQTRHDYRDIQSDGHRQHLLRSDVLRGRIDRNEWRCTLNALDPTISALSAPTRPHRTAGRGRTGSSDPRSANLMSEANGRTRL